MPPWSMRDGGVVKDFTIDMDYLSDNASVISLAEETFAERGDLVAGIDERGGKLFFGCITAVDNTKKTISFKHPKELFRENILNFAKRGGTAEMPYVFDGVAAIAALLNAFKKETGDTNPAHFPLRVETHGSAPGTVWTDDSDTIDIVGFIGKLFDEQNIVVDVWIDFETMEAIADIRKNVVTGFLLRDDIKAAVADFSKEELPEYNTLRLFNKDTGVAIGSPYYLKKDGSITQTAAAPLRLLPQHTKYAEFDAANGATQLQIAQNELQGNIFNHFVQYQLPKSNKLIDVTAFSFGDGVKIVKDGKTFDSIFTGYKFSSKSDMYTLIFGKMRVDFTDRLKKYIDKKYRKK
jgi:hypothetical protein